MLTLVFMAAFFLGSVPTGSLIARLQGIDLRKTGSGNIGATNVMRSMGKLPALLTLAGDMLKGALAIYLARSLTADAGASFAALLGSMQIPVTNPAAALDGAIGITAVLGHIFSVFLRFRGGKGVATALGVGLVCSPYGALMAATIWLVTFNFTRYSSLSALTAFALFPACIYIIDPSPEKITAAVILAIIIFATHHENIARLIKGTESRFSRNSR